MIKKYLEKVKQHNMEFYIGSYDPRKLIRMADQAIDAGQIPEAQRPLAKKRLQEIASYAAQENGLLPASVMIATKQADKLKVEKEVNSDGQIRYYIMLPDTQDELELYKDTIDIIDGQHRLFAFSDHYRSPDLKDDETYSIPFSLFSVPTLRTRQWLFTTTNEKQKPVPANLLLYYKKQLGMLTNTEERYYNIVELLNNENVSPLKGRIIMSAEHITKGYKAKQLIKILDKAHIRDTSAGNKPLTEDKIVEALSTYLVGWENHYGVKFQKPGNGTITKISGLRYILLLFPVFWENAVSSRQKFSSEYVEKNIDILEKVHIHEGEEKIIFDRTTAFRGESATIAMAKMDATDLKSYLANQVSDGFDPLA